MPPKERRKCSKRPRSCCSSACFSLVSYAAVVSAYWQCVHNAALQRGAAYPSQRMLLLPGSYAFSPCRIRDSVSLRNENSGGLRQLFVKKGRTVQSRHTTRLMVLDVQEDLSQGDVSKNENETQIIPSIIDASSVKRESEVVDVDKPTPVASRAATYSGPPTPRTAGLSKFHQRILSSTIQRQRFVTGRYPLVVSVQENPTRKWLGLGRDMTSSTSQVLVNGTSVDRSLASYDRFQWLDDQERKELHDRYSMVSLELLAEINCKKPAYLNVLPTYGAGSTAAARRAADASPSWDRWKRNSVLFEKLDESIRQDSRRDRLWATGFSLTKARGDVFSVDAESGHIESVNSRTEKHIVWPNEVCSVPHQQFDSHSNRQRAETSERDRRVKRDELEDALLISDGFLVPGRDKGGLRIVRNPGSAESEWSVSLTDNDEGNDGWFYHRATWVDLTGDGRKSILTARAKRPSILKQGRRGGTDNKSSSPTQTQLVWLERPQPFMVDEATRTPLEMDGTVFDPFGALHTPWKARVLDEGPDVMFSVADLDSTDDTVEVVASQFFSRKLSLYSIKLGVNPQITFRRTIDENCGAAFSSILANLDNSVACEARTRTVIDSGSTVSTLQPGDGFSHVLVTSHECTYSEKEGGDATLASDDEMVHGADNTDAVAVDGGSLFAYRVPSGKEAWKRQPWVRTVVASGFRVKPQLSNAINPGAPGFCYTFYPTKDGPTSDTSSPRFWKRPLIAIAGDCAESAYLFRPITKENGTNGSSVDFNARYALMCEIQCGATVGSIGIGYDDFCAADQESGYAKIYIPCYEKDKVFVFAMGGGDDDYDSVSDW